MTRILVSEIFGPTVQGEGPLIGHPSVFVRTGGCDYRCSWCDTLHAVLPQYRDEWTLMTPADIMARVNELAGGKRVLITLSGGNPALHPLSPLIALGRRNGGHDLALETQGSMAQPWFADLDWLILSPKPPSSGMVTDWDALDACLDVTNGRPRAVLKIVVFDDRDYRYAQATAARYPGLPVYLQVGNGAPNLPPNLVPSSAAGLAEEGQIGDLMHRFRWLAGKVMADHWFAATVLPQLHVLAWGNKRGV